MALFSEREVRERAAKEMQRSANTYKTKSQVLNESALSFSNSKKYDIFLSHSSKDAEIILGIKGILEDLGYSVYVDWVDDPQLDRGNVSKSTASKLRERMRASKSLFYVTTDSAVKSKWMPWECGYFDGFREKVAIVPVQKYPQSNKFDGQEYLGLYPYALKNDNKMGKATLWILREQEEYVSYDYWVSTANNQLTWQR